LVEDPTFIIPDRRAKFQEPPESRAYPLKERGYKHVGVNSASTGIQSTFLRFVERVQHIPILIGMLVRPENPSGE
jgi:hypothetical protein